jgi:hypothetical protein
VRLSRPAPGYAASVRGFQVTEVQKVLKGFDYPGKPADLARHAESNGADPALVEALRKLEKKEGFSGPSAVMHELSAQAETLGGPTPGGRSERQSKNVEGPSWQVTEVQKALKGAHYPSGGRQLAEIAQSNGADDELVHALSRIRQAEGPNRVMKELKDHLGGSTTPAASTDGPQDVIDILTHDHREVEQMFAELESLHDPSFATELTALMDEIRHHVAEEEGQMFPHMRDVFTPEELVELGRKVEAVKLLAPTRPHPSAPDEPPGDKLLGPITGLLDRMRDAVTHRGAKN